MTFDATDPRLTAYALGELDGSERAEIEALLAESAAARQYVAEIRDTAQLLSEQFRSEPQPRACGRTPWQADRGRVFDPWRSTDRFPAGCVFAAAASLIGGLSIAIWLASRPESRARPEGHGDTRPCRRDRREA